MSGLQRIIEIDFERCFKGLLRGWRFLLLSLILGLLVGGGTAVFLVDGENQYDAAASIYSITYGSYTDSEKGVSAIRTYSDIIKSYKVAERAALILGDDSITKETIYDMIHTDDRVITGTTYVYENMSSVIKIHAVYQDRDMAVAVVNAVADAFVIEVNGIAESDFVHVLDYAVDADVSYSAPKHQMMAVAAGGLGFLLLGCLVILGRIIFSKKIVTVRDASLYGQLEVIGAIPKFGKSQHQAVKS